MIVVSGVSSAPVTAACIDGGHLYWIAYSYEKINAATGTDKPLTLVRYRTIIGIMNFETGIIISLISRIQNKANRLITAELKKHSIEGLAPVHGDILLALFFHHQISMQELATLIDRKKSTITTLVEKLIRLGYVKKERSETDNRSYLISLTPKGKELKEPLIDISTTLLETVYRDIPTDEQVQLVKSLSKIFKNL